MDKRQKETVLRMAVTGIHAVKDRIHALSEFESIDRPDLVRAQSKLNTAEESLEEWASLNDLEITKGMPT